MHLIITPLSLAELPSIYLIEIYTQPLIIKSPLREELASMTLSKGAGPLKSDIWWLTFA